MLALFLLLFVMLGFLGFLVIWDTISSIFKSKMIAGGVIGYLIAKYFQNKDGNRGL